LTGSLGWRARSPRVRPRPRRTRGSGAVSRGVRGHEGLGLAPAAGVVTDCHSSRTAGRLRAGVLGPRGGDLDPGPRPGENLPARLRRERRLAPVGLRGQGVAGVGTGPGASRPEGDRPLLLILLRRDGADLLRGSQVDPSRTLLACQGRPGRAPPARGLDFPDAGQERRLADPTPLADELDARLTEAVSTVAEPSTRQCLG
jgi:hypothetical protein